MTALGDVLIVGFGKSGQAAAEHCATRLGSDVTTVTVVDSSTGTALDERAEPLRRRGVRFMFGISEVEGSYDLAVASPGIRLDSAIMRSARAASRRLVSEVEFAFERSAVDWVAITGTNGKTTTTALVAHLLQQSGIAALAVGNIGTPAISAVSGDPAEQVLVAEVSSFQLALTEQFHPKVAVLLNITPDHIDWHGSFESYAADKLKAFANLTESDVAVIDTDDAVSSQHADVLASRGVPVVRVSRERVHERGATAAGGVLALVSGGVRHELVAVDELLIRGPHNVSNALAAAAAAHAMGASPTDIAQGLMTFAPIEHRLEPAGSAAGAEWFNDSKATNPDAVFKALDAFGTRPLILLLGGRNKGNDFRALAETAAVRSKAVVTFGEAGDEIADAFRGTVLTPVRVAGLADAVETAAGLAEPGDAVVLSPACASFDEFTGFEARGREFKELVRALGQEVLR